MSEIICLRCNAQSPENALYCQHCGQPLRCRKCNAALLPNANACIQCGQLIPERSLNEQFHIRADILPPGYNRLKLHETPDIREVDLTMSDQAIAHIGDLLPSLIGNRPKGQHESSIEHQQQKQSDLVEITSEIPTTQPRLPISSSRSVLAEDSSGQTIWDIFRKQEGGGLKQDISSLKASGKRDYTMRLVYLYLYARIQLNEDKVLRAEVYTFLGNTGLKDNNISRYIAYAHGIISDEDGTLRLNYEGRKQALQFITDVFNSDLMDIWLPSTDVRSASNRTKKPSKKSGEQLSSANANVAGWVAHSETKNLANIIPPDTIVGLSLVDKSLLALYGIYKTGNGQEVPLASLIKYLYDAFHVQVQPNTLSKALYRTREEKTAKAPYVNFREGYGYRITPSGRQYIEGLLKLKQSLLETADVNPGTNGVG